MNSYIELLKNKTPFIDLRSPVEFEKGAFPSSFNLPIMNNEERTKVGIIYKHQGNDAATKLGHKLVSGIRKENRVLKWKQFITKNPTTWMYCMRGGQRSGIAKEWLNDIGIEVSVVKGGFKALRRALLTSLDSINQDNKRWIILGGRTGTGKTVVLSQFSSFIDLEKHANHRGSAFGMNLSPQPTSINFENYLAIDYIRHQNSNLMLEDESRTIGKVAIPNIWFQRMKKSELVLIEITLDERIQNILEDYILQPLEYGISKTNLLLSLRSSLFKIQKRLGGDLFRDIRDKMDRAFLNSNTHRHEDWIKLLLDKYYDPLYDYQIQTKMDRCIYKSDTTGVTDYLSDLDSVD